MSSKSTLGGGGHRGGLRKKEANDNCPWQLLERNKLGFLSDVFIKIMSQKMGHNYYKRSF